MVLENINEDEFGNKSYSDEALDFADAIFEVLNNIKDGFTTEYSFNIESVPAERAGVNLCAKGRITDKTQGRPLYITWTVIQWR